MRYKFDPNSKDLKKEMDSNHSSCIRVRGQRSILGTFIHRTPDDQSSDCKKKLEDGRDSKKRPEISLSDFLNRKLQKTFGPSKSVQGKERPFQSPGTSVGGNNQSVDGANANQNTEVPELNSILDVVLEQFKHNKENEDDICFNQEGEVESSTGMHVTVDSRIQDLRKRRNTSGGSRCKQPAPKGLIVLGDDPRPKRAKYQKSFIKNEKPLPLYNHYANGSGWWGSDMEGIDNDEVGFNEVWEGVGSATLGGLDWH